MIAPEHGLLLNISIGRRCHQFHDVWYVLRRVLHADSKAGRTGCSLTEHAVRPGDLCVVDNHQQVVDGAGVAGLEVEYNYGRRMTSTGGGTVLEK